MVARSAYAWCVLETTHPPTWYLPMNAFAEGVLQPGEGSSFCEFKGMARYWNLVAGGAKVTKAGWSYDSPTPDFVQLTDHIAVYASRVDSCVVDGIAVIPQPGEFYGGWITPELDGPFKGEPGTMHW